MIPLLQVLNHVYIGIANKLVVIDVNTSERCIVDLPDIKIPENLSKGQEDLLKESPDITTIAASYNNALIAVSTHNKQLVVLQRHNLQVMHNFIIYRAASNICFDKNDNIIVADKTGDAYLWQTKEETEPIMLLGHLSMLLDVALSTCNKFIITCDRDEKIRVSHYPNSYNILCYCLGHQEFITSIAVANNQLISASGDGTIRLWNFHNGTEILAMDTNSSINDNSHVTAFKEEMDKQNVEVHAIPITNMKLYSYNDKFSLLAVTLFNCNSILIYKFDHDAQTITYLQTLKLDRNIKILCFALAQNLIVMSASSMHLYDFDMKKGLFISSNEIIALGDYESMLTTFYEKSVNNDISVLYKRKFDNVQEYLERKKQRLEGK